MKLNKLFLTLTMIILLVGISYSVKADAGPKPNSEYEIIGLETEVYYFDLLAQFDEQYVTTLDAEAIENQIDPYYYRDSYPEQLNGYYDADGFASYTLYTDLPHTIRQSANNPNIFQCGYYRPPTVFKVVLVLESGDMIVSDIYEKHLFNASFTYDLTNFSFETADSTVHDDFTVYHSNIPVTENSGTSQILLTLFTTIAATLLIEGLILLAFGYREKKSYLTILYVNLLTQLLLYLTISLTSMYWSWFAGIAALFFGEIIVMIVELILYSKYLTEKSRGRAIGYTFVANLISMAIGFFDIILLLVIFA